MTPQELSRIVRDQTPLITPRMFLRRCGPTMPALFSITSMIPKSRSIRAGTRTARRKTADVSLSGPSPSISGARRRTGDGAEIRQEGDRYLWPDDLSVDHCRGELVYAMAKEHWGGGSISEASKATLAFGYGALQSNRIWPKVDADNMSGILALRRASRQFEGTLRQDVRVRGMFRDVKLIRC